MTDAGTSQRFRDYVRNEVLEQVGSQLGLTTRDAEEIELAMSTTFGIVTMRYIVRLEPLASMPKERVIAELGAVLQPRIDRIFARPARSAAIRDERGRLTKTQTLEESLPKPLLSGTSQNHLASFRRSPDST